MVRIARIACSLCTVYWVLASSPVLGQRVQFTHHDRPASPVAAGASDARPGGDVCAGAGCHVQRPDPAAAAGLGPLCHAGDSAAPLLPQDPNLPYSPFGSPTISMAQMQKFLQDVHADYHFFSPTGSNPLGINDIDLNATFAFPLWANIQTPLLVTPGFAAHFWQGPNSAPTDPADMPPETFDAYLGAAWNPQMNPWFGGELSARVGVYSDFHGIDTQSLRLTGAGLAVLTFSPSIKIKAGIWYLNRISYKLLPAGGIEWTPNPDVRFDLYFPNPKLAQRLTTIGNTDWWWYVSGNYGGGTWTIKRGTEAGIDPSLAGSLDLVDYDDIRLALGLEFRRLDRVTGYFEIGGSFDRQLLYRSGSPSAYYPSSTIFFGSGLTY